jgi:GNAT superfamily N-acetyltransferase
VADRAQIIDTVSAAFADDPVFRYFFDDERLFAEHARVFAADLFDKRIHRDSVWVVEGGRAVAMWDPPATADEPAPVDAGERLDLPDGPLRRMREYDRAVHRKMPRFPHWYLGVLATHPDVAGRRWGRAVMEPGLRQAARDEVPAYLETATERNVGLYQRAGWTVAHTVKAGRLPIWILTHPGVS